jgi:hypothetical protein
MRRVLEYRRPRDGEEWDLREQVVVILAFVCLVGFFLVTMLGVLFEAG